MNIQSINWWIDSNLKGRFFIVLQQHILLISASILFFVIYLIEEFIVIQLHNLPVTQKRRNKMNSKRSQWLEKFVPKSVRWFVTRINFKKIFFILYWIIVDFNVVLVSAIQQNDSVIHIHIEILFLVSLLHNIEQSSLCGT